MIKLILGIFLIFVCSFFIGFFVGTVCSISPADKNGLIYLHKKAGWPIKSGEYIYTFKLINTEITE